MRIQCDRALVYRTLVERRFTQKRNKHRPADQSDVQAQSLREFETFVRHVIAPTILGTADTVQLNYSQIMYAVVPFWWHMFDILPAAASIPLGQCIVILSDLVCTALLMAPVAYALMCKLLYWFIALELKCHVPATVQYLACSGVAMTFYFLPSVLVVYFYGRWVLLALLVVFLGLLNIVLYRNKRESCWVPPSELAMNGT